MLNTVLCRLTGTEASCGYIQPYTMYFSQLLCSSTATVTTSYQLEESLDLNFESAIVIKSYKNKLVYT